MTITKVKTVGKYVENVFLCCFLIHDAKFIIRTRIAAMLKLMTMRQHLYRVSTV